MEIMERGFGKMTIGGATRGFHLGTYQSKVYCTTAGIELDQYFEELNKFTFQNSLQNNVIFCTLLYSALAAYCKFQKQPVDFDVDEVTFWADAADKNELAKLLLTMRLMQEHEPKKSDA